MRLVILNFSFLALLLGCGKTKVNKQDTQTQVTLSGELQNSLDSEEPVPAEFQVTSQHQSPDTEGQQPDTVIIKKSNIEGETDNVSVEILYLTGSVVHNKLTERFILNSSALIDLVTKTETTKPYERDTIEIIKKIRALKGS